MYKNNLLTSNNVPSYIPTSNSCFVSSERQVTFFGVLASCFCASTESVISSLLPPQLFPLLELLHLCAVGMFCAMLCSQGRDSDKQPGFCTDQQQPR